MRRALIAELSVLAFVLNLILARTGQAHQF